MKIINNRKICGKKLENSLIEGVFGLKLYIICL